MHVLVVTQYFWPETFRINDLVSELVNRGHEVTVLTGQPNYPAGKIFQDYRDDPAAFSSYAGAKVIRVPLISRGKGSLRLLLNYASFAISGCTIGVWKIRRVKFDVIFSPQLSPITAMLPAVLIRQVRKRKFAMWVLDLWPDTLKALGIIKSSRLLNMVGRLVGFVYHRTDKLYVQSEGFIPNVLEHTKKPVELEFLPNWSEDIPELNSVEPSPEVTAVPKSFDIMFAGAVGEAQDFPAILEAAEQLKDVPQLRWLIVGDGRVSDWVAEEINRRGLTNIIMLGRHPVETMPSFYKHADVMLVSLKAEPIFASTIPGKIQSYLAAGKPIIAMLDGEGAKVIKSSGAGISVPASNASELAATIRTMMSMEQSELRAMGKASKEYSNKVFDRKKIIDRIERDLFSLKAVEK
ncbi:glycosyltransferase family 4 protein [Parasphingorhabdus halotolerans]|uniref:Glycosyltransferase family 4 protein n=1 Tax=Parasphingorhabdus halotolerans TaxID=2725558 RepID=A0A6H2DR54_9SPHN|nr:glycosyltransferase family 4 protein [Parasphingorhabdus halotolerans]